VALATVTTPRSAKPSWRLSCYSNRTTSGPLLEYQRRSSISSRYGRSSEADGSLGLSTFRRSDVLLGRLTGDGLTRIAWGIGSVDAGYGKR
jgi:hypothetical protein